MKDTEFTLSRRQVLAGIGGVGLASAGAGLGTTAYLNDTESFTGNVVTAGQLDLKVDWEEHYSYPQLYGFDDPTAGLDVTRTDPEDDANYVGLPDPENPMVWVARDDLDAYMDATAIESFPDPDGDGVQELFDEELEFEYVACRDGADVDVHFDPRMDGALRTNNADTLRDGEVQPLVNLDDVKPGDFGELTLSYHLCDNPGYVWLQAANVSESENGFSEPESEVDDTEAAELASLIQTAWWYDIDGDNVIDENVGAVDVMLAVDTSGSLNQSQVDDLAAAANQLASDLDASADARVGGISYGGNSIDDFTALADGPVAFSGLSPSGDTPMPAALEIAAAELDANARMGAETYVVLFTDGGPNYANQTYSAGGYTVGSGYTGGTPGDSTITDSELDETAGIAGGIHSDHQVVAVGINDNRKPSGRSGDASAPLLSTYLRDQIASMPANYFSTTDPAAVTNVLNAILAAIATSEEVFRRGTLADDLAALSAGDGIPLDAGRDSAFDELSDPADSAARECFQPGVNYFIGFAWWLPASVGNEVQGDSVSFDLGFYTEQCRNNDGSGASA